MCLYFNNYNCYCYYYYNYYYQYYCFYYFPYCFYYIIIVISYYYYLCYRLLTEKQYDRKLRDQNNYRTRGELELLIFYPSSLKIFFYNNLKQLRFKLKRSQFFSLQLLVSASQIKPYHILYIHTHVFNIILTYQAVSV